VVVGRREPSDNEVHRTSKGIAVNKRALIAGFAAVALAAGLAACSGGGGGGGSDANANANAKCTNKVVNTKAPKVTVWAWYPNMKTVVDNFNKQHSDVQVCWNNVGQGGD
jgi:multiple sugar transport system substrate-binding protein